MKKYYLFAIILVFFLLFPSFCNAQTIETDEAPSPEQGYEHYMKQGDNDKALIIINNMITENETADLYNDRGIIYLYGYNDAAKALEDFKRSSQIDPDHIAVHTNMGLAYEMLGYHDKAIIAYRTAAAKYPFNDWTAYGSDRARGILLAEEGQLIQDWFFLEHSDKTPSESTVISNGEDLSWFRPFTYEDHGYVNLSNLYQTKDFTEAFAMTYVYSPEQRDILLKIGSDDGIVVWVNGKKVLDNPSLRSARVDDDIIETSLSAGWNTLLLKISQDWGSWGFYFRITDTKNAPIKDLVFDPMRDTERAKKICSMVRKERFLRDLNQGSRLFGVIILLILGLCLLLKNVKDVSRIKKMRNDFIAGVTHDLRVPLSSIKASAEMLIDGKVRADKKQEYYQNISEEAERLNRHINKMLSFRRTETDKSPYSFEETDIVPVIEKAISVYKKESPSDELMIGFEINGSLPPVPLDKEAFTQAMINLLSNADKYSPVDKSIVVSAESREDKLFIKVKDKGIGISPADRKRIFDSFYRGSGKNERNIQGVGLGLSFVSGIVKAHGGKISVDSIPGKGSIFTIEIPIPGDNS